jgi:hypothetical protein
MFSDELRPHMSLIYPPFLNGSALENGVITELHAKPQGHRTLIDVCWTELMLNKRHLFSSIPPLQDYSGKYYTVVQHDDGVPIHLPKDTIVFGACTGHIPIPLIYEDKNNTLLNVKRISYNEKPLLCSFVGSNTHNVRSLMTRILQHSPDVRILTDNWNPHVTTNKQSLFIETSVQSKFILCPRGYGRSSFRLFEAFQLGCVPVYIWDDIEWLPYKDKLDWNRLCVSINIQNIGSLYGILKSISQDKYESMLAYANDCKRWFTYPGVADYIHEKTQEL